VDWSILPASEKTETSNKNYAAYIREAFGNGYRLTDQNWRKLHSGKFYNPAHHIAQMDGTKIMMFHAKDDPYVPWRSVDRFAKRSGARLKLFSRGGHLSTEFIIEKYWPQIKKFFAEG
jgi:predicted alpha/beta hydrolase family esterase